MKWDFFYDENDSKPYQSIHDWHKDIKHLIWPTTTIVLLGTAVYVYFRYFQF